MKCFILEQFVTFWYRFVYNVIVSVVWVPLSDFNQMLMSHFETHLNIDAIEKYLEINALFEILFGHMDCV